MRRAALQSGSLNIKHFTTQWQQRSQNRKADVWPNCSATSTQHHAPCQRKSQARKKRGMPRKKQSISKLTIRPTTSVLVASSPTATRTATSPPSETSTAIAVVSLPKDSSKPHQLMPPSQLNLAYHASVSLALTSSFKAVPALTDKTADTTISPLSRSARSKSLPTTTGLPAFLLFPGCTYLREADSTSRI